VAYTEIKERNGRRYFYRAMSVRKGKKFKKERIYLGKDLSKSELHVKETDADKEFFPTKKLKGLERLKPQIVRILKKYKVKRAGIFGSYARGEEKKNSDVDILIKPTAKIMGFKFAGLEIELSEKLHKKVDLVSYNGISPYLKEDILKQEVRII